LGKKNGSGKLYDNGSNLIYTGSFSQDELLYSALLGKKVSEVADTYKGKRTLYEDDRNFAVVLEDIDAMSMTTIEEVKKFFGTEDYQGNSEVNMPEAVAINWIADYRSNSQRRVEMELSSEYDDYLVVEEFDVGYTVYIYSFHKDGLIYTFICQDSAGNFSFYSIEREEGQVGT